MSKELGFWVAVGLVGVVTSVLLKIAAAKITGTPDGLRELIAAA